MVQKPIVILEEQIQFHPHYTQEEIAMPEMIPDEDLRPVEMESLQDGKEDNC